METYLIVIIVLLLVIIYKQNKIHNLLIDTYNESLDASYGVNKILGEDSFN